VDILEKDLYLPVKAFLASDGWDVKAEVNHFDIAAIKDEKLLAVEMKLTLNLDVILQAVTRQKQADIVYIAVPKKNKVMKTTRWKSICDLLKRLEIGLLLVTTKGYGYVEEAIEPKTFVLRHNNRKRSRVIKEFERRHGDNNVGGVNKTKIITAYTELSIHIATLLKIYGELSPKELRSLGTDHKKTLSILSKNFYGWFENVSRGVYKLSEKGSLELEKYNDIAQSYLSNDES
jgi:hypothetical protein